MTLLEVLAVPQRAVALRRLQAPPYTPFRSSLTRPSSRHKVVSEIKPQVPQLCRLTFELKRGGQSCQRGKRMRRVCAGTLSHHEQAVRERVAKPGRIMRRVCAGCGHTGTLCAYSQDGAYWYTMRIQSGRRVLVHYYAHTVRTARTGTLCAYSQDGA
jgi:hypothetical protein